MSLVIDRLTEHYKFIEKDYNDSNIVGIFLIGSQNYNMDTINSDIDTKFIITPTLNDIYLNHKAESSTKKFPDSNEYISIKDIRCVLSEFKKQGTLLEILFTDYAIVNPLYKPVWQELINHREEIARYNPYLVAKATKGILYNTYERLYNKEGKISPKQVSNLVRLEYFIQNYIEQKNYSNCIKPEGDKHDYIIQIKNGELGETSLITIAESSFKAANLLIDTYCQRDDLPKNNPNLEEFFYDITKQFIDTSLITEYARNGEI